MAEVVDRQPSFFTEVAELVTDGPAARPGRAGPAGRSSPACRRTCPSAFVDERFRFYGTVLSGTPELRERWKRGVALVEGALGEAVGKVYVERHFSPAAKERMDALVANLIEAYRRSITELDWMTEETKASALDKLAEVPAAHRLPGQVAGLLDAGDRRRRPDRQRAAGVGATS